MQEDLSERTEQYIREQKLLGSGDRVLVGLSGGADSVCLLLLLKELSGKMSFSLGAFHVNHGIRGAEAERDELYSKSLCDSFGLPFYAVRVNVPELAETLGIGLEEAGRQARYREAERIRQEHGYTKIALAHHRGDVSETFLFHLFRGSSIGGLASIPPKRGRIIRPLLFCGKTEIEEELLRRGVHWCTDSTNRDEEYTRNRIRHTVLPEAEKINAGAEKHIAQAAEEMRELSEFLLAEAEKIGENAEVNAGSVSISVAELLKQPHVLRMKAVYLLLTRVTEEAKNLTRTHLEQILSLCEKQSGKRLSLPYGVTVRRDFDRLLLERNDTPAETMVEYPVEIPGEYVLRDGTAVLRFRCFPYAENEQIPKNEYTKWFDYGKIKGALRLRTRHDGDVLGMVQGTKSVKSIFNEKKIGTRQRNRMLLLADEEQILWIPGVRACDNYRVDESTVMILEVQMNGGTDHE